MDLGEEFGGFTGWAASCVGLELHGFGWLVVGWLYLSGGLGKDSLGLGVLESRLLSGKGEEVGQHGVCLL